MAEQNFQTEYARYKFRIEKQLMALVKHREPVSVYQPIQYVLKAGGKRVRAALLLLSCEAVGGESRTALPAACAIEILHNFTLVHDDVMDNSPLRRGMPTVHTKWDTNIAILSGDGLVAYAYDALLKTKSTTLPLLVASFTNAFIEVCEGQGFDKEFETRTDVTLDEYLLMINKKTAQIISASCELGAIIGNGSVKEQTSARMFGESLGMAFQIQDDLLDITATEAELGKPIGGDVLEGKKTYLLLKALERASGRDKKLLHNVMRKKIPGNNIIQDVLEIYTRTGVLQEARTQVSFYTEKSRRALARLQPGNARAMLFWLSQQLLERNS